MYNHSCECNMCNNCSCQCSINDTQDYLVAPTQYIDTHVMTLMPQVVVCPIEYRKINHCMTYPVFVPIYCQQDCHNFN